jgi:hypothetical protein
LSSGRSEKPVRHLDRLAGQAVSQPLLASTGCAGDGLKS